MMVSDEHRITKSLIQKGSQRSSSPLTHFINWVQEGPGRVRVVPRCHLWLVGEPDQNKSENPDSWSSCLFQEITFVKLSEKYRV